MSSSNRSNNAPSTRPSNAVRPPPPAPCQLELTDTGVSTYVDIMSDATRLASAAAATDPAEGLRAVAALRRLLEHLESVQVGNARAAGWSWQEIAVVLGVSRQAVHKKHARRAR